MLPPSVALLLDFFEEGTIMKIGNFNLTILVCAVLMFAQIAYIFIPADALRVYSIGAQPLLFVAFAVAVLVFTGVDERPVRNVFYSNIFTFLSLALFGIITIIAMLLFGAGRNAMTADSAVVVRSLWERGAPIVFGEIIRYKLINNAERRHRHATIIMLTIVLAFSQMNALRILIGGNTVVTYIFFESVFLHLVISSMASVFAARGRFLSAVLLSFVYSMAVYLLPILPNIMPLAFTLIIGGTAFATAAVFYVMINEASTASKMREKRIARYEKRKRPLLGYGITAAAIGLAAAFFMGLFPVYPIAVLSGSMSPTFERGSLVLVERVPQGKAFDRVGEGYIIHYLNPGRVEHIHRVVGFRHDADGQREYITRGDAGYIDSPNPVSQYNVLGIARVTVPLLGYPYIFFRFIMNSFR